MAMVSLTSSPAGHYVLAFTQQHPATKLVFHNYPLILATVNAVGEVSQAEGADPETTEVATLGAWFLYLGYFLDYTQPAGRSIREMQHFFARHPHTESVQQRTLRCLQQVAGQLPPRSQEEKILSDAAAMAAYLQQGEERLALRKLEEELVRDCPFARGEWLAIQMELLLQCQLYTHYAKTTYEGELARLLAITQAGVEKNLRRELATAPSATPPVRFQYEDDTSPLRGAQTFFRANYRNHINLSSIADNKANIMISVNSILISVLITFVSYRNIGDNSPVILLPVVIFLVTGLASLVFAVLSARPKVTALNEKLTDPLARRRNIVFFGNFASMNLDEYEEAMDAMFRDNELLYGNMVRDLYYLGKVLDRKYRYLSISYNIFMVGFVATVITFLVLMLT